jgi:apolipoprotein N-acyltransferase
MRGVEGGYAIVRVAQQGLLTVSDHHGRIRAEAASSAGPDVLLVADVRVGPGSTIYGRAGNWFAGLNAVAAIGILTAAGVSYAVTAARRRGGHDTDKED